MSDATAIKLSKKDFARPEGPLVPRLRRPRVLNKCSA
jgi:hypothetical protein